VHRASIDKLYVRSSRKDRSAPATLWGPACLLLACGALACASGKPAPTVPQACVPGEQKACACPGGPDGAQVCADDGSHYLACNGCAAPTGGTNGTGGTSVNGGTGGFPGTGGRGAGGATDAGMTLVDAGDAPTAVDGPLDTGGGGGAPGADGSAGSMGADGAGIDGGGPDGPGVEGGGVEGGRIDGPGAEGGGVDAPGDAAVVGVTITPDTTGLVLEIGRAHV
jgi:hypothetical protein